MARKKVDVITLGCSKNLVDSERLMSMFDRADLKQGTSLKISEATLLS